MLIRRQIIIYCLLGLKGKITMKLATMTFLILNLSFFIILSMSAHMESNKAGANSDPVILPSNHMPATMTPVSIQAASLLENSTLNPQALSLDNMSVAPHTLVTERKWTGSIPTFPTIMKAFKSQINTSMNEATTVALDAVGTNTTAISSTLQPDGGFLVYDVRVVDTDNKIHSVVIDAGNGKVLSKILLADDRCCSDEKRTSTCWACWHPCRRGIPHASITASSSK